MICGIILDVDVSPLLCVGVGSDYLYSVGDKRMESFGVVVYVTKYYLGSRICHHCGKWMQMYLQLHMLGEWTRRLKIQLHLQATRWKLPSYRVIRCKLTRTALQRCQILQTFVWYGKVCGSTIPYKGH